MSAILQDRAGFMWFAGQGGLSRYDGYRFVTYKHDPLDPRSLADDSVQALIEDRTGQLWVGTRNGLQRFDRQREDFTPYRAPRPDCSRATTSTCAPSQPTVQDSYGWPRAPDWCVSTRPASASSSCATGKRTQARWRPTRYMRSPSTRRGDSGPVPPPASTTWRPAAAASPTFRWRHRRRPIPSASRCARWPSTPRRSGSAPRAGWKHGRPAAASRVRAVISARKRASARARSPRCTATGKAGSGQAPRTKA
ncbi:two-component regulator propeller domain-containing protein [Massilia sp. Se16.2.3]|uniref:ligand-binding sensor domain-containing protein n=1 Tax=Massilia sp. Se16.2.3 TaxID=2709303 RepID=UPI0035A6467B